MHSPRACGVKDEPSPLAVYPTRSTSGLYFPLTVRNLVYDDDSLSQDPRVTQTAQKAHESIHRYLMGLRGASTSHRSRSYQTPCSVRPSWSEIAWP